MSSKLAFLQQIGTFDSCKIFMIFWDICTFGIFQGILNISLILKQKNEPQYIVPALFFPDEIN